MLKSVVFYAKCAPIFPYNLYKEKPDLQHTWVYVFVITFDPHNIFSQMSAFWELEEVLFHICKNIKNVKF